MSQDKHNPKSTGSDLPSVGRLALPVWILIVAVMLGYRGCIYVDNVGGGLSFRPELYGPYRTMAQLDSVQPSTGGIEEAIKKGRAQFSGAGCGACHQANGQGLPGAFPPLAGSEWVLEEGHERVVRIVLHGLNGPITVKGTKYSSQMPGLPQLSDESIGNILTYIKNSKEWGNETGEWITPADVKAIRDETAGRTKQWAPSDLANVPNK